MISTTPSLLSWCHLCYRLLVLSLSIPRQYTRPLTHPTILLILIPYLLFPLLIFSFLSGLFLPNIPSPPPLAPLQFFEMKAFKMLRKRETLLTPINNPLTLETPLFRRYSFSYPRFRAIASSLSPSTPHSLNQSPHTCAQSHSCRLSAHPYVTRTSLHDPAHLRHIPHSYTTPRNHILWHILRFPHYHAEPTLTLNYPPGTSRRLRCCTSAITSCCEVHTTSHLRKSS